MFNHKTLDKDVNLCCYVFITCVCVALHYTTGGSKQKWVPLNIEHPRPPPSRGYYRYRGEGRDQWHSIHGRRDKERDYERERGRERGRDWVGRYDRGGRERSHRPWRFEQRDQSFKYHENRGEYGRDRRDKEDDGYKPNSRHWQDGSEDRNWQYGNHMNSGEWRAVVFLFNLYQTLVIPPFCTCT